MEAGRVSGYWIRKTKRAPIRALYKQTLTAGEASLIYFGWAGILLRTVHGVVAIDLCQKNFRRSEVRELEQLDLQCYTHTHWDHWHPAHASAIRAHTGAPILVEPAIVNDRGSIPLDHLIPVRPSGPVRVGTYAVCGVTGIHPRPITLFHLTSPDVRLFHGGDSDSVPLDHLEADIAIVPVGTPSPSCTPHSAVAMLRDVGANVAIPVHGSKGQVGSFESIVAESLPDVHVIAPAVCELVTFRFRDAA